MDHLKRAEYLLRNSWEARNGYPRAFYRRVSGLWEYWEEVLAFLRTEFGIKPLLIGGLAVQHWGLERMTVDIDILLSREDYQKLRDAGKISYGSLQFSHDVQVDVLSEGRDNNPNPEVVRDGTTVYPTLEGLIYLKLLTGRGKDEGDVLELLKVNGLTPELRDQVSRFLYLHNPNLAARFGSLWEKAVTEHEQEKQLRKE